MAKNEAARQTSEAYVVSTTPDVCLTPMGGKDVPVPYSIVGSFFNAIATAVSVLFKSLQAFFMSSRIDRVEGNEAGGAGGVKSGVNRGAVRPIAGSSTVNVTGKPVIRHGDPMEMNCAGPDGKGNTTGKVVYMTQSSQVSVTADGKVAGKKLELPPKDTEKGVLARLLLAENGTPGKYGAADILQGMQATKATVFNRLALNSGGLFNAPGAENIIDIITAKGQFAGFSKGADGTVQISSEIEKRIADYLKLANSGSVGPMYRHVSTALEVTDAPVVDPFDPSGINPTVGMRTAGSSAPGGSYEAVPDGEVAGNQYYSLEKPKEEASGKKSKSGGKGKDGATVAK